MKPTMLSGKNNWKVPQRRGKKKKGEKEERKLAEKEISSNIENVLKMYVFKVSTPIVCSITLKTGYRADVDLTGKETGILFYRFA